MPSHETVRRVPVSAKTMFAVVADVERYPEFLPLCESLKILTRKEEESRNTTLLEADMTVAYGKVHETFRSSVILDEARQTIITKSIKGPFRQLTNEWHFEAVSENVTDVHFKIDYEFKNRMLAMLMGGLFDKVFRAYAESFETRAKELAGA